MPRPVNYSNKINRYLKVITTSVVALTHLLSLVERQLSAQTVAKVAKVAKKAKKLPKKASKKVSKK